MNAGLAPLRSFVLPGGSAGGGGAARGAHGVRGAPSAAWSSSPALPDEPVGAPALKYINRLSDLLFVASRYVNDARPRRRALGAGAEPLEQDRFGWNHFALSPT